LRRGDFVNCQNQPISGVHSDGGYAEMMIAQASGLAAIPDDLLSTEATPLRRTDDVQCVEKFKGPARRTRRYSRRWWAWPPRNSVCAPHGLSSRSHFSRARKGKAREEAWGTSLH